MRFFSYFCLGFFSVLFTEIRLTGKSLTAHCSRVIFLYLFDLYLFSLLCLFLRWWRNNSAFGTMYFSNRASVFS